MRLLGLMAMLGPVFGLLATPRLARADDASEPLRLVWIRGPGAEGCLSRDALALRVSERLGRRAFADDARRSLEGFVQREGERWVAHLYARDPEGRLTGSRDLANDAPDCAGLDAAVTLAIALVIDPDAALRRRPTPAPVPLAPPPAPPPPAVPSFLSPAPPPPARAIEPPRPSAVARPPTTVTERATLAADGLLAGGLLPKAAPGVLLAADVGLQGALHASAGAMFLPEERTSSGDFGFGLTTGFVGLCGAGAPPSVARRLRLSGCAEWQLGSLHSVVYAYEPTSPGDRVWAGVDARGTLDVRLVRSLLLEAGAALAVPVTRQRYGIVGVEGTVFEEAPIGVVGFLGLGASIP